MRKGFNRYMRFVAGPIEGLPNRFSRREVRREHYPRRTVPSTPPFLWYRVAAVGLTGRVSVCPGQTVRWILISARFVLFSSQAEPCEKPTWKHDSERAE